MKLEPASFSLDTGDGVALGPVECPTDFTWSRETNEVSNATITAPRQAVTTDILPWFTWLNVWHGQDLQWRGPVQDVKYDHSTMSIAAKDLAVFMWKTRTVTTRSWNSLDISTIAADMWNDMLKLQNIAVTPVVLPSLSTSGRYSIDVKADMKMMNQDMADLAKLGLRWTVVRGRPILGAQPPGVAAELAECDLTVGPTIQRSGAKTSNDVRVQGTNYAWTERTDMGGLHLQSLVSIDNVYGSVNITRAAHEQLLKRAYIKDSLVIPSTSPIMPTAPVELSMLVPGIQIAVTALGYRALFELQKVAVTGGSSNLDVTLTLGAIPDTTQLESMGTVEGSAG